MCQENEILSQKDTTTSKKKEPSYSEITASTVCNQLGVLAPVCDLSVPFCPTPRAESSSHPFSQHVVPTWNNGLPMSWDIRSGEGRLHLNPRHCLLYCSTWSDSRLWHNRYAAHSAGLLLHGEESFLSS